MSDSIDYHALLLTEVKKTSRETESDKCYFLLNLIEIFPSEKFNKWIDVCFYRDKASESFDECFEDAHKALRVSDVFDTGTQDMLLYHYINTTQRLYTELYNTLSKVPGKFFIEENHD